MYGSAKYNISCARLNHILGMKFNERVFKKKQQFDDVSLYKARPLMIVPNYLWWLENACYIVFDDCQIFYTMTKPRRAHNSVSVIFFCFFVFVFIYCLDPAKIPRPSKAA